MPLLLYLGHESVRDHTFNLFGKMGSRILSEVVIGKMEMYPPSILDGSEYTSLITGGKSVSMMDVFDHIGWWGIF